MSYIKTYSDNFLENFDVKYCTKKIKSKAKLGRASWCVDSRFVLKGGTRKFFWTKEDALRFIDNLEAEASPAVDTTDTWKWTFADLWVHYKKHLKNERRDREISEDNFKIKTRQRETASQADC